jgi:hypothetical protein
MPPPMDGMTTATGTPVDPTAGIPQMAAPVPPMPGGMPGGGGAPPIPMAA